MAESIPVYRNRLVYGFDHGGGFCVVVQGTNLSAYAYATSESATRAARNPGGIAEKMIAQEVAFARTFVLTCGYGRMVERADAVWEHLTGERSFRGVTPLTSVLAASR